jgi:hypothetical protein
MQMLEKEIYQDALHVKQTLAVERTFTMSVCTTASARVEYILTVQMSCFLSNIKYATKTPYNVTGHIRVGSIINEMFCGGYD